MQSMTLDPPNNARAERLREAIEEGPLRAFEIAERLHASRTSVLNWKKRGAINVDNLRGLADITGYRFWWLAFGEGPKKIGDEKPGGQHIIQSDNTARLSPEHAHLIDVLNQASQSGLLNETMARSLASFLQEMIKNRTLFDK
ncbi:helix-turn-helix domain containing protein [Marinobacter koreensis]|uniref:Helix-turn-helix domain containing protein n=1 Tax=Marinobacter koreensis TaxID=335974 RepID=A0ABW0RL56_9GAMM|nr:helix-turn-helix domain containing protein [Marinobacter koreensis]MCK7547171.1 helix-turn-helix domain containing protein [Marinobacter koreensis]